MNEKIMEIAQDIIELKDETIAMGSSLEGAFPMCVNRIVECDGKLYSIMVDVRVREIK